MSNEAETNCYSDLLQNINRTNLQGSRAPDHKQQISKFWHHNWGFIAIYNKTTFIINTVLMVLTLIPLRNKSNLI